MDLNKIKTYTFLFIYLFLNICTVLLLFSYKLVILLPIIKDLLDRYGHLKCV